MYIALVINVSSLLSELSITQARYIPPRAITIRLGILRYASLDIVYTRTIYLHALLVLPLFILKDYKRSFSLSTHSTNLTKVFLISSPKCNSYL
jgi:hypothetical protein